MQLYNGAEWTVLFSGHWSNIYEHNLQSCVSAADHLLYFVTSVKFVHECIFVLICMYVCPCILVVRKPREAANGSFVVEYFGSKDNFNTEAQTQSPSPLSSACHTWRQPFLASEIIFVKCLLHVTVHSRMQICMCRHGNMESAIYLYKSIHFHHIGTAVILKQTHTHTHAHK